MSATQFLELLVSLSLQAAVVVVVTHWLTLIVSSERAHCRMWTTCYISLLLLVACGLLLAHPKWFQPWDQFDAQTTSSLASLESQVGQFLFIAWLVGAIVSVAMFAVRAVRVHRFLKSCQPVDQALLSRLGVESLSSDQTGLAGSKQVSVMSSPHTITPFCWQFHRPVIVVPEFLLGADSKTVQFVLRHELAHLQTGHPLQLFLQRVVESLFWFHPMIWWASYQSARVREFACDAAAIDSTTEIGAYLRALLMIVEHGARTRHASTNTPTMTFGRGGTLVADRARRLVRCAQGGISHNRFSLSPIFAQLGLAAVTLLGAFLWLPVDALASPRSNWSRWPSWSSAALHDVGISAPDFQTYDRRARMSELKEHDASQAASVDH